MCIGVYVFVYWWWSGVFGWRGIGGVYVVGGVGVFVGDLCVVVVYGLDGVVVEVMGEGLCVEEDKDDGGDGCEGKEVDLLW